MKKASVVIGKPSVVIDKASVVIDMAQPRYAGNYTCVPANAKAASVTVHVVQSETPAAMQHGNNSSSSRNRVHFLIILLLVSLMSRLSINGHCKELG
ncbi:hypothetical protein JYU34_020395 [Plutella xylostella]|uniref:Uncharacterized protein n=1 Tax=Plutella xylostella TaxID=51655 RepID=A0ABQ7PUE5_PLUXY|nr:hypothetical protein JYU34_020395 [Plutella xylostella]